MRKHFASMVTLGLATAFLASWSGSAQAASSAPPVIQSKPAAGAPASSASSSEDWKGNPESADWTLSALTGVGIVNATPGFSIIGAAARKILDHGFIPDINNSVWIEAEMGPTIAKGGAAFQFSGHLRWDFVKDSDWTFYALGGFGGSNSDDKLGSKFEFYPRLGVGALWKIFADFDVRLEVSHELTIIGAQFGF